MTEIRSSQRRYSPAALETWFGRLQNDWERHFTSEELKDGRALYRSGAVRSLEVSVGDAIISTQVERQLFYAIVEWPVDRPAVRVSSDDRHYGHALAVAGFYEIEELVADEIPADTGWNVEQGGLGATPGDSPAHRTTGETAGAKARPYKVRLSASSHGLWVRACWVNADGSEEPWKLDAAALGMAENEREKLIRMMSLTHKAGFARAARQSAWQLREPADIQTYLRQHLPKWQSLFPVEVEPGVMKLAEPVRVVRVGGRMEKGSEGLGLKWRLKGGDRDFTAEETELLIRRARTTVILPGMGLFRFDEREAEALSEWQGVLRPGEHLPEYLALSLFADESLKLELGPQLKAWRDRLLRVAPDEEKNWPEFLRPYQRWGAAWLARVVDSGCHPLLADEMGLGKTLQTAALIARRPKGEVRPDLVVCPASVVPVWQAEMERFFPGVKVEVLKTGRDFVGAPGPSLWLSSYSQLRRHKPLLDKVMFRYAILDEAQNIKNPEAKVTLAAGAIQASHRLALTGTPIENRSLDLWTIFRFLMPGLLGSRRRYEDLAEKDPLEFPRRVRRQVQSFVLRRTKNEVAKELPSKVEVPVPCLMTESQQREYRRLAGEALKHHGEKLTMLRDRPLSFFTLLTRLRQVSCDPGLLPWVKADWKDSGKLRVLMDLLGPMMESGQKVVVFSQFTALLDRVREALKERLPASPVFRLDGRTTDRAKPVREFQNKAGSAIFLASLKASGTGVTLHAAENVILLDPWWNPAAEAQAVDRVHRIGQSKTVFVYRLTSSGTVEERVERMKAEKRALFDEVVGGLRDLSELTTHFESLRDLIGLDHEEE